MRRFAMSLALATPLAALMLVSAVTGDEIPIKKGFGKAKAGAADNPNLNISDEDALKQAGLSPTEATPLLEYLKVRTLTDVDQNRIGEVIKKFGADDFEERV